MLIVDPFWVHDPDMSASKTGREAVAARWRFPDVSPLAWRVNVNVLPACNSLVWPVPPVVTQIVGT
jgi:hypothetical protein